MKCPKCQADNPDASRFCGNCATLLNPGGQPQAAPTKTLDAPAYALTTGSLLAGKYRVIEEIGRGGMGLVYLAEDTKLGRKVAVKVLPESFTADPERLARFEREARVLAALNHPSIAAIYGVEEADGRRLLVLELVEGETLQDRLSRGSLPLEEALDVCLQIAAGLECAHEKGIIHRDLKPANVKITPEGKAKILDFGLAKPLVEEVTAADIADSPTITANMTQPGVILGTAAYMSPEQATGRPVDKRADTWAFGCILYECLTGKRAFPGGTVTESMAAVLRGEPDWDALPAGTPRNIRAVLRRCFQKPPGLRLRDIGDARLELEAPLAYPAVAEPSPSDTGPARRRPSLVWLAACTAVALIAGIFVGPAVMRHFRTAPSKPVIISTIKVEPGLRLEGWTMEMRRPSRTAMAISSDDRFVVHCAVEEDSSPLSKSRLYMRRMDQSDARSIAGTEGGWAPFLSPDNRWLGFFAEGKMKKVPVTGGVATSLCDVPWSIGASWGPDNNIVFTDGTTAGLSRISADGGKPEILTTPDPKREEFSHRLPAWLPNGKAVLLSVMRHDFDQQPRLALLRWDTREWQAVLEDAADGRYVPTGHPVFMRQGTLMAVRFDEATLGIAGQPVPLAENIMQAFSNNAFCSTGAGQFDVSDSGSILYATGGIVPDEKNTLVWVDQKGTEQAISPLERPFACPRLSPDGQKIVYSTMGREYRIWVYDLNRGTDSPLTTEGWAAFPVWAPDGHRVLFSWMRSGVPNLFWQPADGSSPMERLTTSDVTQFPVSWSSDGKTVAFLSGKPLLSTEMAAFDVRSRSVAPLMNSPSDAGSAELSPDGRWIAYTSGVPRGDGIFDQVFVRPFPGPGMKCQVSSEGGRQPLWSRNGKQLFYRWGNQMWVADVRTEGGFAAGRPRRLFENRGYKSNMPGRAYDLSLDGQRFIMVKVGQREPKPVTEMVLVQNWFEELKRLVPTGKK